MLERGDYVALASHNRQRRSGAWRNDIGAKTRARCRRTISDIAYRSMTFYLPAAKWHVCDVALLNG
jgi:hypothetical protein